MPRVIHFYQQFSSTSMVRRIAIKVGGSIAIGERGPNTDYLAKFARTLTSMSLEKVAVGIGGGILARNYLTTISSALSPRPAEEVVIELLRANTRFLAFLLRGTPILDQQSLEKVDFNTPSRILVIGGVEPGRSTDANTAILGRKIGAEIFIKMTNVDGVYTADPHTHPDAELIEKMTYKKLLSLSGPTSPGKYGVLDELAIRVLEEVGIPAKIINGRDPRNLALTLAGEPIGTTVEP